MLQVFLEVVLPVGIVAAIGGLVGRWRLIPVQPVSALVFYLFSPSLVFHSLATTQVPGGDAARIVAVGVATFGVMWLGATMWSLGARHAPDLRAGFALTATLPNQGNMGLPLALLAFGEAGLDIAVMNFVAGTVLAYSAGIAIGSMAGGSAPQALRAPFRYPVVYAASAGMVVNATGIDLPVTLEAPAESLGQAAVPVMLVVLGLQLQRHVGISDVRESVVVGAARLLGAPVVAFFLATAMGLDELTRDTLVVLAAMPTAVMATVLATEFNARPDFVTRNVVLSTLLSMVTVTVLITLVR